MKSRSKRKQKTACDACKLRKTRCSLSTGSDDPNQDLQESICEGCRKRNIDCTKALSDFKIPQKVYSALNRLGEASANAPSPDNLHGMADMVQNQPLDVAPPPERLPQFDLPWLDFELPGLHQVVPNAPSIVDQATTGWSPIGRNSIEPVGQAENSELDSNSGLDALTEEETWALLQVGSSQDQDGLQVDLVDRSWLTNGISAVAGPSGTSQSSWFSVPDIRVGSGCTSGGEIYVANGIESDTAQSGAVDRRSGKRSFDQLDQSPSTDPTSTAPNTTTYTDPNASTSATPSSVGRSVWTSDWLDLTPPGRESKKLRTGALSLAPADLGFQDQGNLLARTSERKELSRSLVNTYLAVFHAQYPLLDPHLLRRKFDLAGQDPERLAPTEQVTFACIEAWAARSSLHPAVLRSKKGEALFVEQALNLERVDRDAMSPLPSGRAAVGRSRIPVCQALKDRALRLLDTHGIMRKPSLEGLKSLLPLSNLMMGEIPKGLEEGQDAEMDREMLKSTIAEQIKLLHRHNRAKFISQPSIDPDSDRNLDDFIEAAETAWRASADGQAALRARCAEAMDLKSIRFPATSVYQWIMTSTANAIHTPMVSEMVDEAVDRYRSALLKAKSVTQVVLLTSASCIVDGWITARRAAEQTRETGARIQNDSPESTPNGSPRSPGGNLERLYKRSAMEVLKSVVDFVPVLRSAIPLNLLQNPSPNLLPLLVIALPSTWTDQADYCSTLTALAEAAISIPTEEQGLTVSSLKGARWRNAEKGATLTVCREALSQCTSSWSRVQDEVDALDDALAKMALEKDASAPRDETIERLLELRLDM